MTKKFVKYFSHVDGIYLKKKDIFLSFSLKKVGDKTCKRALYNKNQATKNEYHFFCFYVFCL